MGPERRIPVLDACGLLDVDRPVASSNEHVIAGIITDLDGVALPYVQERDRGAGRDRQAHRQGRDENKCWYSHAMDYISCKAGTRLR